MKARMPKAVFELQRILDNPFYGGFATADFDAPSVLGRERSADDVSSTYRQRNRYFEIESLVSRWVPYEVMDETRGYEDFTTINLRFPVFHRRAIAAMDDLLRPHGELLPLSTNGVVRDDYFFYHCRRVTQAVILENSQYILWHKKTKDGTALDFSYMDFDPEKLINCPIFFEGIYPTSLFVTDEFKERAEEAHLTGFEFIKVWPLPKGTNFRMEHKKSLANQSTPNLVKQTVVIRIPLPDSAASPAIQAMIEGFETQIDEALKIQSLTDTFYGRYVGNETTDGEYRMFLSCPSAKELVKKLGPLFLATASHFPFLVTQRAGPMYKKSAKEKSTAYGAWPE